MSRRDDRVGRGQLKALYRMGHSALEGLETAANSPEDANKRREQFCEANFFAGAVLVTTAETTRSAYCRLRRKPARMGSSNTPPRSWSSAVSTATRHAGSAQKGGIAPAYSATLSAQYAGLLRPTFLAQNLGPCSQSVNFFSSYICLRFGRAGILRKNVGTHC